jgi:Mg2+ and Co2+ transporter CorA
MAVETAKAVKQAVADAVKSFTARLADFIGSVVRGAGSWIKGLFGSVSSALTLASQIVITLSQIDDLQRRLATLRQNYLNARTATNNASSIVSRVSSHYHESYVRSCCRDIENDIRNAQKYIDTAERNLDRRRRVLAEAVNAYRKAEQDAVRDIRNTAASFA